MFAFAIEYNSVLKETLLKDLRKFVIRTLFKRLPVEQACYMFFSILYSLGVNWDIVYQRVQYVYCTSYC